ncbi:hypothetical protein BGW36DRAFT_430515 [Talaromyces proteolyticus]|uniref:Uncharacterized protein n=1 Tax=Talaromyces proteolyticus TaxID=1131652 RepID=A0AAD4KI43_9EURO|nr:uncharacterized protein BGW36DRAFT_430515 [Talaromyces proteolyticus]KAH8692768.1 hypothetical protein BGW36DRAFT_430515 [Talaromyces proteolyticus]
MEKKFVFINVHEPKDALQLAKDPEIRSHVTRHQWRRIERLQATSRRPKKKNLSAVDVLDRCQKETEPSNSFVLKSRLIPPQLGGLRVDPFQSYPMSFQPWMPMLVDHYVVHMAVDIPELDMPGNRGLLRTSWFPLVMTEPALFSVIMLLAASHYVSTQNPSRNMKLRLLDLRCEAVQSINRTLESQQRKPISDALIGAIAKMASYEAMFGSIENYGIHMQGLASAVNQRGGLISLGLSGLLQRIVIWIDRNAAFLHGLALYFPGSTFLSGQSLPDPNPGQFLASS